ncbi:MAG TPA: hypothetical protein VE035_11495 [Puia sp.]|nr:hypothetical protein [Puia sp.]
MAQETGGLALLNMKQQDIWGLIQNGHFEEACQEAELQYEETKNIFPLHNKIYALLHLKKYKEVIEYARSIS